MIEFRHSKLTRIYLSAAAMLAGGALMLAACDSTGVSDAASSESVYESSTAETASKVESDLAQLRAVMAPYHRTEAAEAVGHVLLPGLDFCFDNQPVGGMGYHYIKASDIDATVDMFQPEAWVYQPGPNGKMDLGAVEYLVSAADWDAAHSELPNLFGHDFHPLGDLYILHAWIFKHNPSGMFEDWNPKVTCQ